MPFAIAGVRVSNGEDGSAVLKHRASQVPLFACASCGGLTEIRYPTLFY